MTTIQSKKSKSENAILFIEAARQMIDNEGIENLSVRRIADKAGFHNSTIYLYFKDLDHLIMLASLKHLTEYSHALSVLSRQNIDPKERFFSVWEFFGNTVFQKPTLFFNFFFGKYSNNLTEIMEEYYSYFPNEKEEYSSTLQEMYYGKDIKQRCLSLLKSLPAEISPVAKGRLELINDIIVCCLKSLLEEKSQDPERDPGLCTKRLLDMIHFIVGI